MKNIVLMISILLFFGQSYLQCEDEKSGVQSDSLKPPNPLELEKNWWDYFKVPSEQLPEVIDAFEKNLDETLPTISAEEQEEVDILKKDISMNLQLLKAKSNQYLPKSPPPLFLQQEYAPKQILDINGNLSDVREQIKEMRNRIAIDTSRTGDLQALLDKKIIQYYNQSKSSYERLITGLEIIELRIELGIRKEDLLQLQQMLSYLTKNEELIYDELKSAKDKVNYSGIDRDEIVQEISRLKKTKDELIEKINRLEKSSLHEENREVKNEIVCCLLNYEIITEIIRLETLKVSTVTNEILLSLYDVYHTSEGQENQEPKDYNESIESWEKVLSDTNKSLMNWKKQLDQDREKISKLINDTLKKNKEISPSTEKTISSIHLQIDQTFALISDTETDISGADQLLKLLKNKIVEDKGITEVWSIRTKNYWVNFLEKVEEWTGVTIFHIKDHPVTVDLLIKAVLTILFAFLFSKYLQNTLSKKVFKPSRVSHSTSYIVLRLIHYFILISSFLIALSFLGIDLTNIFIVAGALGVGIGFGLQSLVNNIISGITLLLNRYIKVGDIIELENNVLARVSAINLQFTHICTFDGADKIFPNSEISAKGLTNWTMKNVYRRFRIPFGVAYGTDKNFVREKVLEAVAQEPYVLQESSGVADPQIWFMRYADSSMDFELVAWVNLGMTPPYGTATSSLLWVIDDVLNKENIVVPFPQRDLYIKEAPSSKSSVDQGSSQTGSSDS